MTLRLKRLETRAKQTTLSHPHSLTRLFELERWNDGEDGRIRNRRKEPQGNARERRGENESWQEKAAFFVGREKGTNENGLLI